MGILLDKNQLKAIIREYNLKEGRDVVGAVKDLMKDLLQEMLDEELELELGYSKHDYKNKKTDNSRNGHSKKRVRSTLGEIEIAVPRDRKGEFEPVAVRKGEKDISNIQDLVISMYGKGMTTRDISEHMAEIYGLNVSNDTVTRITDKLIPIIKDWQNRPLDELYAILYLDAMFFNVKQDGRVIKKSAYVILGYNVEGFKEILGIWIGENESAKFWLNILNELKNRGVKDILIACIDGLSGFESAIKTAFPDTEVQRCIVHQIRNSTKFVTYTDRKEFCRDLKGVYKASTEEAALLALEGFSERWEKKYPYAIKSWENNWESLATFFKYPPAIRRLIYTTNPIESFNNAAKKVANRKRSFPSNEALLKILYLSTMSVTKKWSQQMRTWSSIVNQLMIYFGERITMYI